MVEWPGDLVLAGQLRVSNHRHDVAGQLHGVGQFANFVDRGLGSWLFRAGLAKAYSPVGNTHRDSGSSGYRHLYGDDDLWFDHVGWQSCIRIAGTDKPPVWSQIVIQ